MAYLAKSTVLKSYQLLSNIDTDKRQGLTQKVSALKYASALDRYYLVHNQNCNLRQSANKDLFASYVGEIVKINDEQCTKDFFLGVSANGRDFDCGSNFFSQSSVKDSKTNPYETFLYPKRSGWQPVMDVKNQELLFRSDYLPDVFSFYLGTSELRLAFIIWLLRFTEIGEENLDGLRLSLINTFSIDFCNALYIDAINHIDTSYIEFDNKMCQLSQEDILSLFNSSKKHSCESLLSANLPLQQIYYGAPGTGKSYAINELTEGESVIRTTFHPDSDYSTFVGAYKPTMGLLPICDEMGQPMKIGSTILHKEQIIYEFVDQAFLQAYVQAWKYYAENSDDAKKQYLIIEEINRGNCAQIFGDLFQLLDRNDYGFSVYPINADKDMKKQLAKAFKKDDKTIIIEGADKINAIYKGRDVVSQVLFGEILLLPNNLYIWATMNTSDQSLFPIDSAFKRRWEWQYMPIDKGYDGNGQEIKWAIEGATKKFDWWSFLEKINAQIGAATQSEDKKLGFFFCKAMDGLISAEKFVGKVIFYLWNDVFKNNGFEDPIFKDADGTELSFSKFYKSDSKGNAIVQKDKVELFLENLGVEEAGVIIEENPLDNDVFENDTNEQTSGTRDSRNRLHVTFPDGETIKIQTCDEYVQILEKIGLDKAYEVAITDGPRILRCTFVTKTPEEAILNHKTLRYDHIGEYYVLRQMSGDQMRPFLEKISSKYNLGLRFYRE